jgi:uncharacterized protein YrrD
MTTDSFKNAEGRNVVASDTAESIGSVKGFVLDPRGRRIEAIHAGGHGKRAVILPWPTISAFGADAVMAAAGAGASIENDHQKAAVKGVVSMPGSRVLTVDGRQIGTVADVEFDTGSGAVVRVITDHGAVDAHRFRSLGSYALVVDEATPSAER